MPLPLSYFIIKKNILGIPFKNYTVHLFYATEYSSDDGKVQLLQQFFPGRPFHNLRAPRPGDRQIL